MMKQIVATYFTREQLLTTIDDLRAQVANGDSFEGSLQYAFPWDKEMGDPITDPTGPGFRVRASYRVGNSMGQGGIRMVGEWMEVADA
jgi:hypothetical protein